MSSSSKRAINEEGNKNNEQDSRTDGNTDKDVKGNLNSIRGGIGHGDVNGIR